MSGALLFYIIALAPVPSPLFLIVCMYVSLLALAANITLLSLFLGPERWACLKSHTHTHVVSYISSICNIIHKPLLNLHVIVIHYKDFFTFKILDFKGCCQRGGGCMYGWMDRWACSFFSFLPSCSLLLSFNRESSYRVISYTCLTKNYSNITPITLYIIVMQFLSSIFQDTLDYFQKLPALTLLANINYCISNIALANIVSKKLEPVLFENKEV